nr:uncharacterized protein LOC109158519 [Ipomoea batatas]
MDELQRRLETREGSSVPQETLTSPFTEDIIVEPLPRGFRFPTMKLYTGSADPRAHLNRYRAAIMMTNASDDALQESVLTQPEESVWATAPLCPNAPPIPSSVPSVSDPSFHPSDASRTQIESDSAATSESEVTVSQKKKQFATMCKLEQGSTETLTDYLAKWKKEARSVEKFDEKAAISIFTSNVRLGPFHRDLVQNPTKSYAALLDRATRFVEVEDAEWREKEEERGSETMHPRRIAELRGPHAKGCGWPRYVVSRH